MEKLLLSDTDIHLLMEFEKNPSIELLARTLAKDGTVISRQLKKISAKADVLVKASGRWKLSPSGIKILQLSRDFIRVQNSILNREKQLRIGTNREFASKVVAQKIPQLQKLLGPCALSLTTYENGVEDALLAGEIEIGLDCGRPWSPDIQFRHCYNEEISAVASPVFFKTHSILAIDRKALANLPHIYCHRLSPHRIIAVDFKTSYTTLATNDIASARAACVASVGWALLPNYAIQDELSTGKLRIIDGLRFTQEKYGVWMVRLRQHLQNEFQILESWLKEQSPI